MAVLAAALPYIIAGTAVAGGIAKAQQDKKTANILEFNAGQKKAAAQRQAIGIQQQTQLRQGRLKALAAASGGGADDPTVQDLQTQVGTEGEYRRLNAMYEGDVSAQGDEMQASALRSRQTADVVGGVVSGASSAFGARTSFYSKYAADTAVEP